MNKPIKRHETLKTLSHEHHHGLLLCWKIRTGIKNNIELSRIKKYTDWFYVNHLIPHFEVEEKYFFPILGKENELIKKAIAEHRRLKRLFENDLDHQKSLSLIEEELDRHIRFEERVLFNEIQRKATQEQLLSLEQIHSEGKFVDNLTDTFWE
ncbi:MAG: hemerythrin domain-containing protein [Lutibacter sp.]|uniref:hemerythrin domain-containing protein n=1 Tax=Lutibacter sp. TaxID=1925666 RepID=UPI00299D1DE7|nr:hemerythrin domain-containing protein [Lutibacter sp.]MDX1829246.1 hemerythrin domain-containing protein [Lutibacter sp.]